MVSKTLRRPQDNGGHFWGDFQASQRQKPLDWKTVGASLLWFCTGAWGSASNQTPPHPPPQPHPPSSSFLKACQREKRLRLHRLRAIIDCSPLVADTCGSPHVGLRMKFRRVRIRATSDKSKVFLSPGTFSYPGSTVLQQQNLSGLTTL